jgi:hypothetical protein
MRRQQKQVKKNITSVVYGSDGRYNRSLDLNSD